MYVCKVGYLAIRKAREQGKEALIKIQKIHKTYSGTINSAERSE